MEDENIPKKTIGEDELVDGILKAIHEANLGIYHTIGILEAVKQDLLATSREIEEEERKAYLKKESGNN